MIEFKNVSKHFGPTQVLHNIDLNIRQGEVVVIIGPSGSGKSSYYAVSINWKRSPPAI